MDVTATMHVLRNDGYKYEFGEWVPDTTLTVSAGWGDQASLPTRVGVALDTLSWACPRR